MGGLSDRYIIYDSAGGWMDGRTSLIAMRLFLSVEQHFL